MAELLFVIDPEPRGSEAADFRRPSGQRRRDRLVAELGTPEGVFHHGAAGLTEHVMGDVERGAERRAVVRGGWLDEDLLEGRLLPDLPVGDAVHSTPASKAEPGEPRPHIEAVQYVEGGLLVDSLEGRGERLVLRLERILRPPGRAQESLELGRVDRAHRRLAVVPRHAHAFRVVAEVAQVQLEPAAGHEMDQLAEPGDVARLAVRREPHHLILVAVLGEAEVLREGEIEESQRMGEVDPVHDVELLVPPHRPRGAYKISEPVDRADRGLLERRHVERAGQVRRVMLDPVHALLDVLAAESQYIGDNRCHPTHSPPVLQPIRDQPRARPLPEREERFTPEVRAGISGDREMTNLRGRHVRQLEARADRIARKPRPVLDPSEALLFDGSDELAIAEERGGDVTVVGVNPEDDRWQFSFLLRPLVWGIANRMQTSQAERKSTCNGATRRQARVRKSLLDGIRDD